MNNERKIVTLDDLERRGGEMHRQPYFDWIRHVVSLATAALTALIALQSSYLSSHPQLPILLAACWLALLVTILLGILVLRTEYITPLNSVNRLRALRAEHGDEYTKNYISKNSSVKPPWYHSWAVRLMVFSFVLSLVLLCIFAVINLLVR